MSYRSLVWKLSGTSKRYLVSQPFCSPWVTVLLRRSFASDNSGNKPFRSGLSDRGVRNPFDGSVRAKKVESVNQKATTVDPATSVRTAHKHATDELESMKKLAEELLKNTEKTVNSSSADEKASKTSNGEVETNDIEQKVSMLGGSTHSEAQSNKVGLWKKFTKKLGMEIDQDATDAEKKRQKMARNTKIGSVIVLASCAAGFVAFCFYYGRPKRDENGNYIHDEFSGTYFAPFYRIAKSFREWRDYVTEPSRELLLPDPLPQHLQPKYTLVIEMKNVLVAPEWTYKTGHRFKKRPALDYFLEMVGYPNFEVVIYTSEAAMTAPQIIDSFDQKQRIMYRLYRDCTKYMKGHHVKDLSRLNRDLSKVIYIDFDPQSFQLNPENVLRLPKWEGDMDDTSLVDLAELLKTIYLSNVEDVRPTLQYYSQFDNPLKEFRQRAIQLAEQERLQKERLVEGENTVLKRYSGRLFGYRRHS